MKHFIANIRLWIIWVLNPIRIDTDFMKQFMEEYGAGWKFESSMAPRYDVLIIDFWRPPSLNPTILSLTIDKGDAITVTLKIPGQNRIISDHDNLIQLKRLLIKEPYICRVNKKK